VFFNLRPPRSGDRVAESSVAQIAAFLLERLHNEHGLRVILAGSLNSDKDVLSSVAAIQKAMKRWKGMFMEFVDVSFAFLESKTEVTVWTAGDAPSGYKETNVAALNKALSSAQSGFAGELPTYRWLAHHSTRGFPKAAAAANSGTLDFFGYLGIQLMRLNAGTSVQFRALRLPTSFSNAEGNDVTALQEEQGTRLCVWRGAPCGQAWMGLRA